MAEAQIKLPPLHHPDKWRALARVAVMDPYALWALATKFRTLRQSEGKTTSVLSFAVELPELYTKSALEDKVKGFFEDTKLAPKLLTILAGLPSKIGPIDVHVPDSFEGRPARFVTVRLHWAKASDEDRELAVLFLLLLTIPVPNLPWSLTRVQMGDPRGWNNQDAPLPGDRPNTVTLPVPPRFVLGVIEDDAPFAHAALRSHRPEGVGTRVLALWDQTTTRPDIDPWDGPLGFRYGRQLDQVSMNGKLAEHIEGHEVDEDAVYADPAVRMPRLRKRASHGAAVTSLMAGTWRAAPRMPQMVDPDMEQKPDPQPDAAGRVPLVMVQLPVEQTTLSSGRWLAVNALDGLRYILDVALSTGGLPAVVVNMSYGAVAGPHDGTGMLEEAIDELVTSYAMDGGQLAVVLAAGNTHGVLRDVEQDGADRLPSGAHAKVAIPYGDKRVFTLFIPPDKQTETHVELWFDAQFEPDPAPPAPPIPGVSIVVTPPDGQPWEPIKCSNFNLWPDIQDSDEVQAGLMFFSKVAQGNGRSMALLTVAATQVNSTRVSAPTGRWRIEVVNDLARPDARPVQVEAWVERDDTTVGARRGQSARFVGVVPPPVGVMPDDANTFTNVATGDLSFVAGAVYAHEFALEDDNRAAPYTAEGVDDLHGPLLSAVAEMGQALRGIRASGSQSGMVVRANGTSMAAPQAARWILNKLDKGLLLKKIRPELQALPRGARVGHKV